MGRRERRKLRKFWHLLRDRPFVVVVFNADGSTTMYHKGVVDPHGELRSAVDSLAG